MSENTSLPVAVIGAGPIGLAAAVHLIQRDETPIIFEAGENIAHSVRQWKHVQLFSPWEFVMDKPAVELLEASRWQSPPLNELPTGQDLVEHYLEPLANLPVIQDALHLNSRVIGVSRLGKDKMKDAQRDDVPFVIQVQTGDGDDAIYEAKAVIDASGTWTNPNPIGSNGLYASGERKHADRIFYGIPDIHGTHHSRFAGKRVAVIGGGHSAINALLELTDILPEYPDMHITWILRKPSVTSTYGGLGDDALPARGQLGVRIKEIVDAGRINVLTPFHIRSVKADGDALNLTGDTLDGEQSVLVDEVIATTGFRPDLSFLREVRVNLDASTESTPILAPMIDPNIHSCGTVRPHGEKELRHPEKGFYIVGMKSYGRAPTFLLATGYEQVRSVVASLVGDWESAEEVQLRLPETGVCGGAVATSQPVTLLEGVNGLKSADLLQVDTDSKNSCC